MFGSVLVNLHIYTAKPNLYNTKLEICKEIIINFEKILLSSFFKKKLNTIFLNILKVRFGLTKLEKSSVW